MNDLEQVEIQIEMATRIRKLRDNCVKLLNNPLWKDVIEEGYFKEESARLVMAKSSNMTIDQTREEILAEEVSK